MEKLQYQVGDVLAGGKLFREIERAAGEKLNVVRIHLLSDVTTFTVLDYVVPPPDSVVTTWRRVYFFPSGHDCWELISIDSM